ncbi:MAG TPA: metallophosphoesterase family protein [Gemmataceae bacterium]|nr:metallophosphoesterase family protein [Gemmataceae bacterium]
MELLLFSDLHTDRAAAQRLVERSRFVDIVIGAGDFGNMRRNVRACFEVLRAIDKPAVLVAGNNESTDELREASRDWPTAIVLHGSGTRINGVDFFGIGGGIPVTPFGSWSFDFTEEQAAGMLKDCPTGCVLVSHAPPHGILDIDSGGKNRGSSTIREAVLRLQPILVVCGHIHACGGRTAMLDKTTIINAGPAGVEWHWQGQG